MAGLFPGKVFAAHLLIALYLSPLAASSNTAVSSSGNQPVGWQGGGNTRGTWDIVTSCLSTIFACTWSVQHLNVPGLSTSDSKWRRIFRSCKWMVINILFPEFIVLHAALEHVMAMQALKLMADNGKPVGYPWWWWWHRPGQTSPWQRLRRMLPFSYQDGDADPEGQGSEEEGEEEEEELPKWTLTHCFLANMGGIVFYEDGRLQFPMTGSQLATAHHAEFDYPVMTEEDIQDRSKTDWFAKGVAVLQFSQLALSIIVRTNQGLAFSQLETITLGFAVCGALIYLIYFHKPQNLDIPFKVTITSEEEEESVRYEKTYDSFWDILRNERAGSASAEKIDVADRIPNDNIPLGHSTQVHPGVYLLAIASGLFGGLHAIAWNFEFPTTVERILWQTATLVAAGSPVIGLATIPFAQLTVPSGDPRAFMEDCLRLMREYSWHVSDRRAVNKAYERLEKICIKDKTEDDDAKQPYKDIFREVAEEFPRLGRELLTFVESGDDVEKKTTPLVGLNDKFVEQLKLLCDLIEEKESKKLCETAKTNVFPRKNLLPKALNLWILSLRSALYFVARLALLAVALSSLRRMPESVYVDTPWTAYIPTLGSTK